MFILKGNLNFNKTIRIMRQQFQLLLVAIFSMVSISLMGQNTISGNITDTETGEPLIGANIIVKGTTIGTTTDIDGNFTLDVKEGTELEISYTGFATKTIDLTSETNFNIALETGLSLDEIVVSASRQPEKVINAPSSISVISSKRIDNTSVANPLQFMKNTAGVSVSEHSAERMSINMRGQVSTNFSGIYVARDYKPLTQPGNGGFFSSDHSLSTLDIERLEVVRGPGSALYGPVLPMGWFILLPKTHLNMPVQALSWV